MLEVKVLKYKELPQELKEEWETILHDEDGHNFLVIYIDGELSFSYRDYGEQEDNSFLRDYSWVAPLIEKAYKLGKKDGIDKGKQIGCEEERKRWYERSIVI